MRTNPCVFCLFIVFFCSSNIVFAQTINFEATWKEFLENNKISNMSELVRPNKVYDPANYSKYLLMNTNTSFCQSEVEDAEDLMEEIQQMDPNVHKAIPGFLAKKDDLEKKINAYYSMDELWERFLKTKEVSQDELDAIIAAKTSCEKTTLAKYSYMSAYTQFCRGDISKSKDIFENRTLKLTEKTTLRIDDVKGLADEVARMKTLYKNMSKLETAWKSYVKTGVSQGFDIELPLFRCNPNPNMKALLLKGALDLCNAAPDMLEKIEELEAETGVKPDREVSKKIKELEAAVELGDDNLLALNKAWDTFITTNDVKRIGQYGYKYCNKEALIRAYILDGFSYVCDLAEDRLEKIDSMQRRELTPLNEITMSKINELSALNEENKANGAKIEKLWNKFVSQGNKLSQDYESAESYCDNIHQVKDWTMKGLSANCETAIQYLERIEEFQQTFEFDFTKDLRCRIEDLKFKVWDCRYQALQKLARIEATAEISYEDRLKELVKEYGIGDRPEACSLNK